MKIKGFSSKTLIGIKVSLQKPGKWILLSGAALLLLCIFAQSSFSQTTWAVEGSVPSYGEFNSPLAAHLPGPLPYFVFPAPVPPPPPCTGNLPFPPMVWNFGGTAIDNNGNPASGGIAFPAMVHTDGITVEMTNVTTGAFILSMVVGGVVLPGTISGVGYDSLADIVWVTDGTVCAGLGLPPPPCGPAPVVVPPFGIPLMGGPASGLGWDPITGTLWFCDQAGFVVNCTIGGALLGSFTATGLAPTLMGLTVNTTNGNIQVTDGNIVAEFTPLGALAVPGAFYLTTNPYGIPLWGAPVSGLGFSLRPQKYGKGYAPTGPPPSINIGGSYPWAGNTAFTVMETGAAIGSIANLIIGFTPAPGLPLGGFPGATIWLFPIFTIVPLGPVTTGTVTVTLPVPAAPGPGMPPVGVPVYLQFLNIINPTPLAIELSDALALTIGQI